MWRRAGTGRGTCASGATQLGNVFESQILLGGIRTQRSAANTMVSSPNRLVASAQVAPNLATSKIADGQH
jgi:hypothetical protein